MLCVFDNYERVVLIVYANVDLYNGFVQLFAISWNKLSPEKKKCKSDLQIFEVKFEKC